jgi:hypothetical protein
VEAGASSGRWWCGFLPWCLRPTARNDVLAGGDLLLVVPRWWWRGARRGHDGRGKVGRGGGWGTPGMERGVVADTAGMATAARQSEQMDGMVKP